MPSLFMEVEEVMEKTGTKKAKAYSIIKELNRKQYEKYPYALIISGKVNRKWFETCTITSVTDNMPTDTNEWVARWRKEYEEEKKKKEESENA